MYIDIDNNSLWNILVVLIVQQRFFFCFLPAVLYFITIVCICMPWQRPNANIKLRKKKEINRKPFSARKHLFFYHYFPIHLLIYLVIEFKSYKSIYHFTFEFTWYVLFVKISNNKSHGKVNTTLKISHIQEKKKKHKIGRQRAITKNHTMQKNAGNECCNATVSIYSIYPHAYHTV